MAVSRWQRSARKPEDAPAQRQAGAEEDLPGNGVRDAARLLVVQPLEKSHEPGLLFDGKLLDVAQKKGCRGAHRSATAWVAPMTDRWQKLRRGAGSKGLFRCRAEIVESPASECLTGAALALDRGNTQMPGCTAHLRESPLHDGAASHHGAEGPLGMIDQRVRRGGHNGRQVLIGALEWIQGPALCRQGAYRQRAAECLRSDHLMGAMSAFCVRFSGMPDPG